MVSGKAIIMQTKPSNPKVNKRQAAAIYCDCSRTYGQRGPVFGRTTHDATAPRMGGSSTKDCPAVYANFNSTTPHIAKVITSSSPTQERNTMSFLNVKFKNKYGLV